MHSRYLLTHARPLPILTGVSAYGTFNALVGAIALPASLLAANLWQGLGAWSGFCPAAPFHSGAMLASIAAALLWSWPPTPHSALQ